MSDQLVITALGADRPGIVDELSEVLFSRELNIEDSRMSVLGGEFAILLLVSGTAEAINGVVGDISTLEQSLRMKLLTKVTSSQSITEDFENYIVEVEAIDHPGIVHKIASFFSSQQVNIEELSTERYSAAHTATPMFSVAMIISIPSGIDSKELSENFLDMCDELNLDASITPAMLPQDE
jgi:glycine cleavage system transcriptional repressor